MPELCWWLIRNDFGGYTESAARKALRLPKPVVPSVAESDLVPSVPATSIIRG